jgi:hypothetical protein
MHAFNFSSMENVEMAIDSSTFITDQESYSKLKTGSLVQVRRVESKAHFDEIAWINAVRIRSGLAREDNIERGVKSDSSYYDSNDAKNEAALALAALSDHISDDSRMFWSTSASAVM